MTTYSTRWLCFPINLKDVYLHVSFVEYHHNFLKFVWQNKLYQWRLLPFWLVTAHRVFMLPYKLILFLCWWKGFCIIIYLEDILFLICSKHAGKRTWSFLYILFVLCCALIFISLIVILLSSFLFRTVCGYSWYVYLCHLNSWDSQ